MRIRREELLNVVSEPMVKNLKSHTKQLVMSNAALLVIMTIITKANCKYRPWISTQILFVEESVAVTEI